MSNIKICEILFGSHLYGTDSEKSDKDYKGVWLPTWKEIALNRVPKQYLNSTTGDSNSRNTSDDVDIEIFSLHTFVKEALAGQTFALDMVHASKECTLQSHPIWDDLVINREKFYSKSVDSFIGYALGQASKYGIKGSRLNDAKAVLDWLEAQDQGKKVQDCEPWTMPTGEHINFFKAGEDHVGGADRVFGTSPLDMVEVCSRKFHMSVKVGYARDIVNKFYENYGARAKQAANDEGIDWKAISHAFRAGYQIKELFSDKTITFPRPEAEFLKDIKYGRRKYVDIAPILEDLMDEVKVLKDSCDLPEKPDKEFWDNWLVQVVEKYLVPDSSTKSYGSTVVG